MSRNFYIADLHLGHSNSIKFDNRPFESVKEMDQTLIDNWNKVVSDEDTVYILGDFCWSKSELKWIQILNKLKGEKVLIRGNHDLRYFSSSLQPMFKCIKDYDEIKDNGKRVILSHYPIPFYRAAYNPDMIHLYGHIHTSLENNFMEHLREYIDQNDNRGESKHKGQFYNVGCMMPWMNYTPKTLEEILNFK